MVLEGAPPQGMSIKDRVKFFENAAKAQNPSGPSVHASAAAAQLAPLAGQVDARQPATSAPRHTWRGVGVRPFGGAHPVRFAATRPALRCVIG